MKSVSAALVRVVLFACLLVPSFLAPQAQSAPGQPAKQFSDYLELQKRVQQISAKVRPCVVAVRMSNSSGSGCLISEDGWISTAGHVSGSRPGTKCRIILFGGETLDAETYGWHEAWDYGLIKADTKGKKLPFCPLGDATKVVSGEWLIAMGHPLGPEPGRDAVVRAGRCLVPDNGRGMIVMDAPVISGDSGGPVFNLAGEIIAINQSIQTNNVTINNVTPSVPYRDMLKDFRDKKGFGNAAGPQWGSGVGKAVEGALTGDEPKKYEEATKTLQDRNLKRSCELFDELLKPVKRPAEVLYNAACAYSLYSASLKGKEAEDAAAKAIAALKRSTEAGWNDMAHAAEDTDLDPVRNRKDFKEWMDAGRKASLKPVLGLTVRFAAGLRADEVIPNSPADKAGMVAGDIIERVGNSKMERATDWVEWAIEKGITENDPLRLKRAGKRVDVKLSVPPFGARVFGQGGARIMELTEAGLAFNAGLKLNDVIVKVGDTKVEGALEFANAMMLASGAGETVLEVKRGFSRELIKFSYSTGDVGGPGSTLARDEWKQGNKLLALWEKTLADKSAGTVFPLRQKGKQIAFATVVRKEGLLVTKASQIDPAEKFELLDGTEALAASIVARNDRFDLAVIKVARTFTKAVSFAARPTEIPPIGTMLATVDAKGKALAHGFVALPEYDTDKIVGEPDPNGPFMGIGAKDASGGGAEITSVTPGQPADKGGLKVGDIVRKLEGQAVADWASMAAMIQSRRPDETITLEVLRDGKTLELKITLMPRAQALGQQAPSKGTGKPELGIQGCKPKDGGAEIGFVRAGSPAELAGISSGEILLKIDDTAVSDQKGLDAAVNSHKVGDRVALTLRRAGKEVTLDVELAEQDAPPPPPGGGRPNVKGPINDRYTHFSKVIQHDGVVLPSQQGSPVYDLEGNVIGLNIARADRTRTFALSAQRVATILDELLKDLR